MKDNLYIVGIPTSQNLVTQDLMDFINQNVPTIYLNHLGEVNSVNNTFNGYNFFVENNFVDGFLGELSELSEEFMTENKVIVPCPGLLPISKESTPDKIAEKLLQICETVRTSFSTTRIVYLTHGSPYLSHIFISAVQDIESNFNIHVMDCDNVTDSSINTFFKIGMVFEPDEMNKPHFRKIIPPYDRSGIFFNNMVANIPTQTHTDKSFAQITDETVLTYSDKNVLIAWSGGIDSTTVLAAFVKNKIPFKVTINASSESENKELYDHLVSNYDVVNIPQRIHSSKADLNFLNDEYCIVTGDCADQLYPGIHHSYVPGGFHFKRVFGHKNFATLYQPYFDAPVEEKYLFNNAKQSFIECYCRYFKCDTDQAESIYDNYLLPHIRQFPFEVKHYYQLVWFFKFIFYYKTHSRNHFNYDGEVKAFFDTEDYQRWALTNLDYNWNTYSTHYNNYKLFEKQYNYEVFGMESLLRQTKYQSSF